MKYALCTQVGSREINEDSVGVVCKGDSACFVVADGLGGHGMGDIASKIAVDTFTNLFDDDSVPFEEVLPFSFARTQERITLYQKRTGGYFQMKTTACALVVHGDNLFWGHIGDTRLYAFKKRKIKTRTLDHSVPQMLVEAKEIKEKDIRHHPDRNKLLRVLGVAGEAPRYELSKIQKAKKYHAFLLCTDGFWEQIYENEMVKCLTESKSVEEWLTIMKSIVEKRGASTDMDNYSAIAVWM